MREFFSQSLFFGVALTFLCYQLALFIQKKLRWSIFNPLLVASALIILVLLLLRVDYDTYNAGAQYITYLLTPATVCLAIPLYEQIEKLKTHRYAILGGVLAGVLTNLVTVLGLSMLFGFSHTEYVTLLPKSVTTAIAAPLSAEYGGIPAITVASVAITALLGAVISDWVCRLFRITEPVAQGLAMGTAAHASGTIHAMGLGEVQGAMSSLAIAVAGILTVIIAPFFVGLY